MAKSAKLKFMYNFKNNNMLRNIVAVALLLILCFLFVQSRGWDSKVFLLVCLSLITIICTHHYSNIKGLVIALGLAYVFIFLSLKAFLYKTYSLDVLSPILIILFTYLGVVLFKHFSCLAKDIRLKDKAVTDSATGLFTQRYFELKLEDEFNKASNQRLTLSLVAIATEADINNAALAIKKASRVSDFVGCYDKGIFFAILAGEREEGGLIYAEKIKKAIEDAMKVNASLGIVNFPDTSVNSWQQFLQCALAALHKARENHTVYVYRDH